MSRRTVVAGMAVALALTTSGCTTVLTDVNGKADASATLVSQKDIDNRTPDNTFWGDGAESANSKKTTFLCTDHDFPEPDDIQGSAEPNSVGIDVDDQNAADTDSLTITQTVVAFSSRSAAKKLVSKATKSMNKCPKSEELKNDSGSVATNLTYLPKDYAHSGWTGRITLSKTSAALTDGSYKSKGARITVIMAKSNVAVMLAIYGLGAQDQDTSLSAIRGLVDQFADQLDAKA